MKSMKSSDKRRKGLAGAGATWGTFLKVAGSKTDTHGSNEEEWVGFDLDGTLAEYDGWKGIDHIGEPIKPMVDKIKKLREDGVMVKIVTARVAPKKRSDGTVGEDFVKVEWNGKKVNKFAREFIAEWCHENLGFCPEIVHEKDHSMKELYDDRCKQVLPNCGVPIENVLKKLLRLEARREPRTAALRRLVLVE